MKERLVDVLNARNTVLHVFPIVVEDENNRPVAVDPEQEALELAKRLELAPEVEVAGLHTRPHVSRGGPLMPYSDAVKTKLEHRIRERAYFMWKNEGCPDSRDMDHWNRARVLEYANFKRDLFLG